LRYVVEWSEEALEELEGLRSYEVPPIVEAEKVIILRVILKGRRTAFEAL